MGGVGGWDPQTRDTPRTAPPPPAGPLIYIQLLQGPIRKVWNAERSQSGASVPPPPPSRSLGLSHAQGVLRGGAGGDAPIGGAAGKLYFTYGKEGVRSPPRRGRPRPRLASDWPRRWRFICIQGADGSGSRGKGRAAGATSTGWGGARPHRTPPAMLPNQPRSRDGPSPSITPKHSKMPPPQLSLTMPRTDGTPPPPPLLRGAP